MTFREAKVPDLPAIIVIIAVAVVRMLDESNGHEEKDVETF